MRESVLVSLAILSTNWEERRRSYLDNFVPFIADCLRRLPRPEVSAEELRQCAEKNFGLSLPYGALEGILKRASKESLITRAHGIYVRNDKAVSAVDINPRRADALRQYEALVTKYRDHARATFGTEITQEQADASLLEYIEEKSLPILSAILHGDQITPTTSESAGQEFLVSHFVSTLAARDPDGFQFLETVVKGSMLASALYFPEPGSVGAAFDRLTVYLDTPFIIRALGYSGVPLEQAATELLGALKDLNAKLAIWTHTLEETRGVFEACVGYLRSPHRNREAVMPMVEYCLESRIGPSQIEARIERLEETLTELGIETHEVPPYTASVSVDEEEFEEMLQKRIRYRRAGPRVKDVNSITAIFRLRGGRQRTRLESAGALFVTTNPSLVRITRRFFQEDLTQHEVPLCLLDHELATVAWLKRPAEVPDLPRKQILADCYAALYPDDELWRSYLEAVERLRADEKLSEDDYFLLRYSVEARRALMHETLGKPGAFTVGTIDHVLERSRKDASADALRQARLAAAEAEAQRSAVEREKLDRRRESEEYERRLVEKEEQRLQQQRTQELHIRGIAVRRAHRIARTLSVFLGLCAVAGLLLALIPDVIQGAPKWITGILAFITLIAFGLGAFNAWIGTNVRDIEGKVEAYLAQSFEKQLRKKFLPSTG